jgi:hypothetical protein
LNPFQTKETVYFPKLDDVNIDMFTDSFDRYTTALNNLADSYDSVKTNLIVLSKREEFTRR